MKAVVFDMDGIIFDSEKVVLSCWEQVADKYGIEQIQETCKECLGVNAAQTRQIFKEKYGQDFPYDTYKQEMSAMFREIEDRGELELKPGIVELLMYLKENNYKIGLASSTRKEIVEKELTGAGIRSYFQVIVAGDMVEKSKPEPDIFLKACELLEVNPLESYAIEDSYNGIRAAKRAGMKPIMVPDLMPPTPEMKELSISVLPSLIEVKEYIKEMTNKL